MKAREFFTAAGRQESDTARISDIIAFDEGKGRAAPERSNDPEPTTVASEADIAAAAAPAAPAAPAVPAKKNGARKR